MRFQTRKKQTPAVPILPLIDILTILLIFFVVTSQFKKKRQVYDVTVATVDHIPTQLTIADNAVIEITEDGKYSLNAVKVEKENLEYILKIYLEEKADAVFDLMVSEEARDKHITFVQDVLAKLGVTKVNKVSKSSSTP